MPQQPIDFASLFPSAGTASFRFTEQIEGHFDVTITYKSRDAGGKRHIDLSVAGLPDSVNPGLFDRIVLAGNNMELHRALLRRKTVDISPPFVISPDPAVEDNIAVLFPVGGVGAGFDNGPFRGIARKSGGGNRLELKLVSKGSTTNEIVYEGTMTLGGGEGILAYFGRFSGAFFKYERKS